MKRPTPDRTIESRWPAALTILAVMGLLMVLPDRLRLLPIWLFHFVGIVILLAIAAVQFTGATARWRRIERLVTLFSCIFVEGVTLIGLVLLVEEMINGSKAIDGLYLLASSMAVWVTNVLVFSLVYWQMDGGGPEARLRGERRPADWLFAEPPAEDSPVPWRPTFVDYLFLGFTTATAFSPTDTLPVTHRAKLLMMAESSVALLTFAVVAARAINILGS